MPSAKRLSDSRIAATARLSGDQERSVEGLTSHFVNPTEIADLEAFVALPKDRATR